MLALSCGDDDIGSHDGLEAQSQAVSHLPWAQGPREAYWKGSGPGASPGRALDVDR